MLIKKANNTNDTIRLDAIKSISFKSDKIVTGPTIDVSTTTIGTAGGSIFVSKPDSPINGMEIIVPPNSYSTAKTFNVSYAEVKSHALGQYFNPITPLISVGNEGGFSDSVMSIKIPIKLPSGHFAMGFIYDETTGKIEGMPIESLDNNSIKLNTRLFGMSNNQLNQSTKLFKASGTISKVKIIIASIAQTLLGEKIELDSKFEPGIDDWEFMNYHTYILPKGKAYCSGQSISAIWYYIQMKSWNHEPLFHKYDKINIKTKPEFLWEDNPLGIRISSTLQKDFNWHNYGINMYSQSKDPGLVWLNFVYAMTMKNSDIPDPQLISVSNNALKIGHIMIVYKINIAEGKLYVADPNYPNNIDPKTGQKTIRTISYSNGNFTPYFTGLNYGEGVELNQIGFIGKNSFIEWSQVGKRWVELENGTIGSDRFPAYNLNYLKDGSALELKDGLVVTSDILKITCTSDQFFPDITIYDTNGNPWSGTTTTNGITSVLLNPGQNKIGIYVTGNVDGNSEYVDFKWVTVNYKNEFGIPCPGISTVTYAGKTYNTVQIGSQCWLKENLDIGEMITSKSNIIIDGQPKTVINMQTNNGIIEKYCYDDDPENCLKFGGLYQWNEAMNYIYSEGTIGICPEGWHIPIFKDYHENLYFAVNANAKELLSVGQGVGENAGTNTIGFSALLSGYFYNGDYYDNGNLTGFWSSSISNQDSTYALDMVIFSLYGLMFGSDDQGLAHSIRCIKD